MTRRINDESRRLNLLGESTMKDDAGRPRENASDSVVVARSQLEQLQRLAGVGAVASSVAHEFNNILTTILNHAQLGMRSTDPEAMTRSLDKILGSARRAAKITTGMLAQSRNRSAKKDKCDVVAMIEEVLSVLEKDLSKHQVRLEKFYTDKPTAEIVTAQIEQVLMNLIINARQAMPAGGRLVIGVKQNRETGMVEISIKDTGVGIEPKALGKIFEPFYSTKEGPDQSGHGGSGLGLSICREIIERHQGRIRVESTVGKGTTFTIKLPAKAADVPPPTSKAA